MKHPRNLIFFFLFIFSVQASAKRSIGTDSAIDNIPSLCRLEFKRPGETVFGTFCSGAVTGENEITTAAHCKPPAGSELRALCGPTHTNGVTQFAQTVSLGKVHADPRFRADGSSDYNLATFTTKTVMTVPTLKPMLASQLKNQMKDKVQCFASGFGLNEEHQNLEEPRSFPFEFPDESELGKTSWRKDFSSVIDPVTLGRDSGKTAEVSKRIQPIQTPDLMAALQETPDFSTEEGRKRDRMIQQRFFFPLLRAVQPVAQIKSALTPGDTGGPVWCKDSQGKGYLIGVNSALEREPMQATPSGGFKLRYRNVFSSYQLPQATSSLDQKPDYTNAD